MGRCDGICERARNRLRDGDLRCSGCDHCRSTFAAESFVTCAIAWEKIHIVPYGVRLDKFERDGEPPQGQFEVLFAGSVSLQEGFPYLLQAFAQVVQSGKRVRVAGAMHAVVRAVLSRLPQDQVEFLGSVSQERLAELMSTSHVMVLPSIEEGLALVQGQAMACGCPIIASTNTGALDLFTDGVEGFIVPVADMAAMTARMQQLADDPALQVRMRVMA